MEEKTTNKFHALQLFTDTFTAETVHLTNEAQGIYIRLICFSWTKNTKPFTTESAFRICQCKSKECEEKVLNILLEFFTGGDKKDLSKWTHKRLTAEHEYLTAKYKARSEAGRKGGLAKSDNASSKIIAPIPIPSPIPNKQLMVAFEEFWSLLHYKKGSKKLASQRYLKECRDKEPKALAEAFNNYASKIQDKQYCAQVSTYLNQRRFEDEETNKPKIYKEPDVFYKGIKLRKSGEFGDRFEYTDSKGGKYEKHKWKKDAEVIKVL